MAETDATKLQPDPPPTWRSGPSALAAHDLRDLTGY